MLCIIRNNTVINTIIIIKELVYFFVDIPMKITYLMESKWRPPIKGCLSMHELNLVMIYEYRYNERSTLTVRWSEYYRHL